MQYQTEYSEFIASAKQGTVSGESAGLLVARFAQYYAEANMNLAAAENALNRVRAEIAGKSDPDTDKPISVAKAEILTSATPESVSFATARVHLQNIEQMINALKCLQRGVLNEYSHMSLNG